jgi:hypothetical protein
MQPDRDLDRELRNLGPHVEYPPTPDLVRSVRGRLEAENGIGSPPARTGPQLWWVAAAALVLLVALPVFATVLSSGGFMSGGAGSAGGGGEIAAQGGGESGRPQAADDAAPTSGGGEDMPTSGGGDDMPTSGGRPESGGQQESAAGSSAAACFSLPPVLEARPARGAPGDEFGIRGEHFDGDLRDCDDDPARDVRIEFLQDRRTWDLGVLVSDKDSRLAAKLRVPADAGPGRAVVRATLGKGPPEDPYGRQSAEARFLVIDE